MSLVVGNKMQLRPYQEDIINQTLMSNDDTLIQVPTGGGKTFIARQISLALIVKDKQVLFVTPRKTLLEQTEKDFYGLGAQVIHGSKTYDYKHKMLISTLQTAIRRKELKPDVIIIDEVHYGYSGKMINELKENNSKSRIIGLSATPYDKNGELLRGFGLVLDRYDMDYMIENKYLVPIFSKVLVKPNLRGIKIANNGDYDIKELGDRVGRQKLVMEIVSSTLEHIEKSKKCIVFAVDINHAKLLAKTYKNKGIRTEVLHSELENFEQERTIRRFKENDFKLLVSVSMITMGFNVPDVDMAVIARPTKSQNLYKQMVGRITRLAPNKEYGTLLDCGSVIKNLGLPAEPIIKHEAQEYSKKNICPDCGNEKLLYRKINSKAYWVCESCGFKKDIVKTGGYKCKQCEKVYKGEALTFDNNQIVLNCTCGHSTVISKSTGRETLVDITDPRMIKLLKNRLVKEYKDLIAHFYGAEELKKENIQKHIKAFELYIESVPSDMVELDLNEIINKQNRWIFSKFTQNEMLGSSVEVQTPKKSVQKVKKEIKKVIDFERFIRSFLKKKLKKYQKSKDFEIQFYNVLNELLDIYEIKNPPILEGENIVVRRYYNNGSIKYEQYFEKGTITGQKAEYSPNGNLHRVILYTNGKVVEAYQYNNIGIRKKIMHGDKKFSFLQSMLTGISQYYLMYFKYMNKS